MGKTKAAADGSAADRPNRTAKPGIDRWISGFVGRLRAETSTLNPSPSDTVAEAADRNPAVDSPTPPRSPIEALGTCTDVRQALAPAVFDYERIYRVEPTAWGLEGGYTPPPCPPPVPATPGELPPIPQPGCRTPLPPVVRRHPPRPFRLFDGAP